MVPPGEKTADPSRRQAAPNPYKTRTGLSRIVHAGINSVSGLRAAWRTESAFRQEVTLAVVLLPLALWLGHSWTERALLAASVWLVIVVEPIRPHPPVTRMLAPSMFMGVRSYRAVLSVRHGRPRFAGRPRPAS